MGWGNIEPKTPEAAKWQRRAAAQKQEKERLSQLLGEASKTVCAATRKQNDLIKDLAHLLKYADHKHGCKAYWFPDLDCTCGYAGVLAKVEKIACDAPQKRSGVTGVAVPKAEEKPGWVPEGANIEFAPKPAEMAAQCACDAPPYLDEFGLTNCTRCKKPYLAVLDQEQNDGK